MAIADLISVIQRSTKPMSMGLARSLDGFAQTAIDRARTLGTLGGIPGDASRERAADALAAAELWITGDDSEELAEPHAQDLRNAVAQCLTEYDGVVAYVDAEGANAQQLYADTLQAIRDLPSDVGNAAKKIAEGATIGLGFVVVALVVGVVLYVELGRG